LGIGEREDSTGEHIQYSLEGALLQHVVDTTAAAEQGQRLTNVTQHLALALNLKKVHVSFESLNLMREWVVWYEREEVGRRWEE
jgi:hypothetical protein